MKASKPVKSSRSTPLERRSDGRRRQPRITSKRRCFRPKSLARATSSRPPPARQASARSHGSLLRQLCEHHAELRHGARRRTPATLAEGEVVEIGPVMTPFVVTANEPFAVASLMLGGTKQDPGGTRGDPSITMEVTPEQFRKDYIVGSVSLAVPFNDAAVTVRPMSNAEVHGALARNTNRRARGRSARAPRRRQQRRPPPRIDVPGRPASDGFRSRHGLLLSRRARPQAHQPPASRRALTAPFWCR